MTQREKNAIAGKVLVFDSGVGGLSIVDHIREQLPNVSITYLADNRCFPYGLLRDEALVTRSLSLLRDASERYRPDIIVLACNSASTIALPTLRTHLSTPIVGVVPAIKPAAEISATRVIGLLATPGTIQRTYTDDLIDSFAADCEVIRLGAAELVQMAEDHFRGQPLSVNTLTPLLEPLLTTASGRPVDTVVLACTHFPLIREPLRTAVPSVKHWVDSGEAIARRVGHLLGSGNTSSSSRVDLALVTDLSAVAGATRDGFSRFGFSALEQFSSEC